MSLPTWIGQPLSRAARRNGVISCFITTSPTKVPGSIRFLGPTLELADPALFDPEHPALRLAAGAFERACGPAPVLIRLGGTLPLLAILAERGVPTVVSGFVLDADAIHAPNESFRLESLRLGERSARELYMALAELKPG